MKKIILINFLFVLIKSYVSAQISFQKTYDQTTYDYGNSVKQTTDGGYIIAGSNGLTYPIGQRDVYLIKTNANGDVLWTKTYGGSGDDEAYSVQQTFDGGYILAGYTKSFGLTNPEIYLIKTDATGFLIWSRIIYGTGYESSNSVQQTLDGGYIITGGSTRASLFKIDANGYLLWSKLYRDSRGGNCNSYFVQQTFDRGYIISGRTFGSISGVNDLAVYIIKADSMGKVKWSKAYADSIYDNSEIVRQTSDSGFIIGASMDYSKGNGIFIIKTDINGDTMWTKTFNCYGFIYSLGQTYDGGYIIGGMAHGSNGTYQDVYLIKTDAVGDTLWTRSFGGIDVDYAYSVEQTSDSGFVVLGKTISFKGNNWDVYLIKTDVNGNSECNVTSMSTTVGNYPMKILNLTTIDSSAGSVGFPSTVDKSGTTTVALLCLGTSDDNLALNRNSLFIFPNPLTSSSTLQFTSQLKDAEVIIYDMLGHEIMKKKMNGNRMEIERGSLVSGVYFVRVVGEEREWVEKIVVE